jgi:hypothetical protein
MLTIKDLSVSKELDNTAMTEVRGGSNFGYVGGQFVAQGAGGVAIGSPNIAVKADTLTQVDDDLLLNVLSPFANNVAL